MLCDCKWWIHQPSNLERKNVDKDFAFYFLICLLSIFKTVKTSFRTTGIAEEERSPRTKRRIDRLSSGFIKKDADSKTEHLAPELKYYLDQAISDEDNQSPPQELEKRAFDRLGMGLIKKRRLDRLSMGLFKRDDDASGLYDDTYSNDIQDGEVNKRYIDRLNSGFIRRADPEKRYLDRLGSRFIRRSSFDRVGSGFIKRSFDRLGSGFIKRRLDRLNSGLIKRNFDRLNSGFIRRSGFDRLSSGFIKRDGMAKRRLDRLGSGFL